MSRGGVTKRIRGATSILSVYHLLFPMIKDVIMLDMAHDSASRAALRFVPER
jgi:hypothetical protein